MQLIDVHSHWKTKRGYVLRTEAELAQQGHTWRSTPEYATEQEQADDFRRAGVRVILDFGFTKFMKPEEAAEVHDYGFATERAHADVILGHWVHFQPERKGAHKEFKRCIEAAPGFIGLAVSGSGGVPASDPAYDKFYKTCIEAKVPALVFVGTTGLGAGLPGGAGILLDHCHPRHLDAVAARYPELTIVAARPAWPWQTETIAVLLHKRNIWYELHGWSPRYLTPDLKHEIARRLQDRVMFGADYPLLTYERLVKDWQGLGFEQAILDKVFHGNAERFLASMKR